MQETGVPEYWDNAEFEAGQLTRRFPTLEKDISISLE